MNVNIPQLSVDTYIALALVIATPWLYYLFSPFSPEKPSTKRDQALSLLLLIHTLYMLHALLVAQPPNIFKSLDLPPNIPPDYLREKLVESLGGDKQNVPPYLDILLKRLGLSDLRALYFRFGHNVLTACSYCQSFNDFALYALPTPLLEYIREIAFIGAFTLPTSPMAHLRPLGLGSLIVLLMTEVYQTLTVQFVIPSQGDSSKMTMWHDTFVQIRHGVFFLLPLILTVIPYLHLHQIPILNIIIPAPLPSTNVPSSAAAQPQHQIQGLNVSALQQIPFSQLTSMTVQTLNHLVPSIRLIKYSNAAIMRSQESTTASTPSLHSLATKWWGEEAREGSIIRNDENVRNIMKSAGWSFDEAVTEADGEIKQEGILLTNAKKAVEILKEQGGVKSEHWL